MSRFRFDPSRPEAVVGLPSAGAAAWIAGGPSMRSGSIPLGQEGAAGQSVAERIATCRQHLSSRAAVTAPPLWVLSSFTFISWMQTIPVGIHSIAELASVISQRARFLYGKPPCGSAWVTRGDWHAQKDFVCQAIPQSSLDALGQDRFASLLSLALVRLQQLSATRQALAWYAITGPGEWHLVAMRDRTPLSIRSGRFSALSLPLDDQLQQVRALWQREQLVTHLPSDKLTWWDCDVQDAEVTSAPDIERVSLAALAQPIDTSDVALRMALAAWSPCHGALT